MAILTKLKYGFEGYAPWYYDAEVRPEFHGGLPVKNMFSVIYRDVEQEKDSEKEATFCFYIDKADAIALEQVLTNEKTNRSMRSETFYAGSVFMTCIAGSMPIISFLQRGFSFRYRYNKDYDELLKMVTKFLDTTELDDELKKLRAGNKD
jgi:hypothetical protein